MLVLDRFTNAPDVCAYLPDRQSRLEYEYVARMTGAEYEARMDTGWRKFGRFLFHPVCSACTGCRSIRIPLDRFKPTPSQRRTLRRNADLTVRLGPPLLDPERLSLYRRYHATQSAKKGWRDESITAEEYATQFLENPVEGLEVTVWDGGALAAVVLADLTPNVLSAVYHFHDPALAKRSVGTYSLLRAFDIARRLGKRYAYLGYFVAGCSSMTYKTAFRPVEVLGANGQWA